MTARKDSSKTVSSKTKDDKVDSFVSKVAEVKTKTRAQNERQFQIKEVYESFSSDTKYWQKCISDPF